MSILEVDFGTHNLSGTGRPTNRWESPNRLLVTTETQPTGNSRRAPVSRLAWNAWLPKANPDLCLAVSRRSGFLRGVDRDATTAVRLHKSGKAEKYAVATPDRWAVGRDINLGGLDATLIGTHLIQDAWHHDRNRSTDERRDIWTDEWAKVLDLVKATQDRGRLVLLGGDFNNRNCPTPDGLRRLTGPGLDHLFVSDARRIIGGGRITEGPKTGSAGYTHHSITAHLKIRVKES